MRFYWLLLPLVCGCVKKTSQPLSVPIKQAVQVVGDIPLASNRNASLGLPTSDLPGIIISRNEYVISWNSEHRELNWSSWQLTPDDLGDSGRSNNFAEDPALDAVVDNAVSPNEYKGTCFDRGHQTPSGDRTDTAAHNSKTFYMSNMIPQTAYLNRVTWEHLENYERNLVEEGSTIFIYAGPIFGAKITGIGPDKDIAVPTRNFKILADTTGKVLVSVIMPNVTSTGTDPLSDHQQACYDSQHTRLVNSKKGSDDWKEFAASITDIEAQSGLKFNFLH